jgi:Tol biopolymer transport system component
METDYPVTRISDGAQPSVHGYFDLCPESPDGQLVVYTRLPADGRTGYRVCLASRAGGDQRLAGPPTVGHFHWGACPQWIDAATIAFPVPGESRPETACVNLTDGRVRRVPGALRMYSPAAGLGLTSALEARSLGLEMEEAVFLMDLARGTLRRVLSLAEARRAHPRAAEIEPAEMQLKHPKWSPDGRHFFAVFHNMDTPAYREGRIAPTRGIKALVLAETDGGGRRYFCEFGHHPVWHPCRNAIITGEIRPDLSSYLVLHPLAGGEAVVLAENTGTHSSVSPDGRFVATDRLDQPRPGICSLELIEVATGKRKPLAVFRMPPPPYEWCHPHPVWSRDGRRVYFNAADAGAPQVYAIDLR